LIIGEEVEAVEAEDEENAEEEEEVVPVVLASACLWCNISFTFLILN